MASADPCAGISGTFCDGGPALDLGHKGARLGGVTGENVQGTFSKALGLPDSPSTLCTGVIWVREMAGEEKVTASRFASEANC